MNTIQYVGEHLWIHYAGHFLVLLAFFSALFSVVAFILNFKNLTKEWESAIKIGFYTHWFSILSILFLIFFIMSRHYYEYQYVWAHVSDELPMKYILSAFWEGQEGSFLLWIFWNCLIGFFLLRSKNKFNISNTIIVLAVNFILTSMLLGIYIGDSRIGSSPFVLLRHVMDIPLFNNAEYLSLIKGNGLNPLLQNYWNIIHPPILFLGFSSTIVPFAFSLSGLIYRDYTSWLKAVLPWALFSGFILGTGILMGGAWAYEALSFGGYWAWDPVENMSLVPWIVLIAGIHTNLIAKSTQYSITPMIATYLLSFFMVVYSSFLTRSGILGDSSAHAFTQMGLEWQLVIFCTIILIVPSVYLFKRIPEIPRKNTEEQIISREFWMFIGSLVLLFSALLISFTTSIPVYNKILDLLGNITNSSLESYHRSTPLDPVAHHNQYQIWIGIFIGFLASASLYLKYLGERKANLNKAFLINLSICFIGSLALSYFNSYSFENLNWSHALLLWSAWFAIVSSLVFFIRMLRFQFRLAGTVLSHGGFGILLLGILFTGINKKIISSNQFAQQGLVENWSDDDIAKHLTLIKDQKMFMNGYWVQYLSDTFILKSRIYELEFWKEDTLNNKTESFKLYPEIQYDNKLTKVAASNPSTKHYINKDVFSLIAQIPQTQVDVETAQKAEDSLNYETYFCKLGDTFFTKKHVVVLSAILNDFDAKDFEFKPNDQKLQLIFKVKNLEDDTARTATPSIVFRNNLVYRFPYQIDPYQMRIQIPDTAFSTLVPEFGSQKFNAIVLKKGNEIEIGDQKFIKLIGFSKDIDPDIYVPQENEIAISAQLEYRDHEKRSVLNPIYLIKGNQVISLPVSAVYPGITIRFTKINPATEEMSFDYAVHAPITSIKIPLKIAENASRNDFIVIQVTEFPWINLVWFGSIVMLLGLLLSAYYKRNTTRFEV
ncbi:MAG: cytochrome c biogenesis protein CcsA [Saprospiraceae bacterium]